MRRSRAVSKPRDATRAAARSPGGPAPPSRAFSGHGHASPRSVHARDARAAGTRDVARGERAAAPVETQGERPRDWTKDTRNRRSARCSRGSLAGSPRRRGRRLTSARFGRVRALLAARGERGREEGGALRARRPRRPRRLRRAQQARRRDDDVPASAAQAMRVPGGGVRALLASRAARVRRAPPSARRARERHAARAPARVVRRRRRRVGKAARAAAPAGARDRHFVFGRFPPCARSARRGRDVHVRGVRGGIPISFGIPRRERARGHDRRNPAFVRREQRRRPRVRRRRALGRRALGVVARLVRRRKAVRALLFRRRDVPVGLEFARVRVRGPCGGVRGRVLRGVRRALPIRVPRGREHAGHGVAVRHRRRARRLAFFRLGRKRFGKRARLVAPIRRAGDVRASVRRRRLRADRQLARVVG